MTQLERIESELAEIKAMLLKMLAPCPAPRGPIPDHIALAQLGDISGSIAASKRLFASQRKPRK